MKPSPQIFRLLALATISSLVGFGLLAWQLSYGAANPTPRGTPQWSDTEFLWTGGKIQTLSSADTRFFEAPYPLAPVTFTLKLSAQIKESSGPFTAWGIALINQDGTWTIVSINGVGYVTARQCPAQNIRLDECTPLTEPTQQILTYWKPFRFIHLRGGTNIIHLDYSPSQHQLSLRLNREWMWDLPYDAVNPTIHWGLWMQGGSDEFSTIIWDKAQVWANE